VTSIVLILHHGYEKKTLDIFAFVYFYLRDKLLRMNRNETEQISCLTRELDLNRERYQRLLNVHIQLQNQNCLLEERILALVESYASEKKQFEDQFLEIKQENLHLKQLVDKLETENQRYKNDCQLAVGLLQQYPNEFISKSSDNNQDKLESVVIPTFPPVFLPPPSIIPPVIQSLPIVDYESPSAFYLCSKCHQLRNHSDASVQTSFQNMHSTNNESHSHSYITVKEYPKKLLSDYSIPQMHHL